MPGPDRIIERLERADARELHSLFVRVTAEQEAVLRAYLGDDRFERMRRLASAVEITRGATRAEPLANVVVLHGIMGSDLATTDNDRGNVEHVWVHYWRILRGNLWKLRLAPDGRKELDRRFTANATGVMKKFYGETLLSLARRYNVRAFWYDWRKDLHLAADALHQFLNIHFQNQPVHLVAHSMGGLVSRTFIADHPDHWESLAPNGKPNARGGRLIMLGTPNHGSFVVPQIITGLEPMVRKLEKLDFSHDLSELLAIVNTFPGSYQMLPSPLVRGEFERLYAASTYKGFDVPQAHLDAAREFHNTLAKVIDEDRMVYVAGYDQLTFDRILDYDRIAEQKSYGATNAGDGRVPHALGLLKDVPTYYVRESHGDLPINREVLEALPDLLENGETKSLPTTVPQRAREVVTNAAAAKGAQTLWQEYDAQVEETRSLVRQLERVDASRRAAAAVDRATEVGEALDAGLATTAAAVAAAPAAEDPSERDDDDRVLTPQERQTEEEVTRGFLGSGATPGAGQGADSSRRARALSTVQLQINVVVDSIADVYANNALPKADAVAVGNYIGVRPQDAILALDREYSAAVPSGARVSERAPREHLLLSQYVERGVIRGELGQTFLLPDPRAGAGLVVAVAGMGFPGRFGNPELVVLVRELCWALGRLGKKHLASVLIGSGRGNLSVGDAVESWLDGLAMAVRGSGEEQHGRLAAVTFVELSRSRAAEIDQAIRRAMPGAKEKGLDVQYDIPPGAFEPKAAERSRADDEPSDAAPGTTDADDVPTRITLTREHGVYTFGAITNNASIPERNVPLDQVLIEEINDLMVTEPREDMQLENGQLLGRLLLPSNLTPAFFGSRPVVLALDAATARIHWEMVARTDLLGRGDSIGKFRSRHHFFGTGIGLTRQLRTTFAPPPEAPPPARRVLRVLVVADPAADAPLPGAQQEGEAVADLFESYNSVDSHNEVHVTRLIGPRRATRVNFLREVLVRQPSYDVLHFAGHCFFDPLEPSRSGWIFSDGQTITARELDRIDRIPPFVFSNACESGITPDRSGTASSGLAPSFAEAFYKCGVSNFVCTGWPVDDRAAREFAVKLYSDLLGLKSENSPDGDAAPRPAHMYEAMRNARLEIASTPGGALTWGAYQHYGNPFYRFFAEADAGAARKKSSPPKPNRKKKSKPQPRTKKASKRKRAG